MEYLWNLIQMKTFCIKVVEGFRRKSSQYLYTDSLLPMVADLAPLVKSLQCKWSDSLHYSLGINVKSCKHALLH